MKRIPLAAWFLATALGAAIGDPGAPPPAPSPAAPPAAAATPPPGGEFPPFTPLTLALAEGERLSYQIRWGVVDAGKATLIVRGKEPAGPGGPEVWNLECRTRSSSFVSLFYRVHDDIRSRVDVRGGFTRLFDMDKTGGSVHSVEHIAFDYGKGVADYTRTRTEGKKEQVKALTIPLPGPVHDPLSCLYYVRGMDLQVGGEYRMTVNTSRKNWVLTLKVLRREKLSLKNIGAFQALVVEPEAQYEGIFVRKGKMTVWLEEKSKVPLKVQSAVAIGSVSAELVKAENSSLPPPEAAKGGKKR